MFEKLIRFMVQLENQGEEIFVQLTLLGKEVLMPSIKYQNTHGC